jgi:hypothetical protein
MLNILRVYMIYDFKIFQMKMQMTSYECIMVNVRGQCSWSNSGRSYSKLIVELLDLCRPAKFNKKDRNTEWLYQSV